MECPTVFSLAGAEGLDGLSLPLLMLVENMGAAELSGAAMAPSTRQLVTICQERSFAHMQARLFRWLCRIEQMALCKGRRLVGGQRR